MFAEALIVTEAIYDVRESGNCAWTFETHFTLLEISNWYSKKINYLLYYFWSKLLSITSKSAQNGQVIVIAISFVIVIDPPLLQLYNFKLRKIAIS